MLDYYLNYIKNLNLDDIQLDFIILFTTIGLSLIIHYLRRFPIISMFNTILGFFPTLIHELGHAIVCTFTFGKVKNIKILITQHGQKKNSASGYAEMNERLWIGKVLTAFAGYVFPSLIILLGVYCITHHQTAFYLLVLITLFLYYFIKTKQKLIAFTILLTISMFLYNMIFVHEENVLMVASIVLSVFLGLMIASMLESILTRTILTFIEKNDSWDGASLQQLTLIPQFIWYILWLIIDIIIIYQSIQWLGGII